MMNMQNIPTTESQSPTGGLEKVIENWRGPLLQSALQITSIIGLIGVFAGVAGTSEAIIKIAYIVIYLIIIGVTIYPVPFWLRAGVFLSLLYILGMIELLVFGILGDVHVFFLPFALVATLLYSPRAGIYAVSIILLSFLVVGTLMLSGQIFPMRSDAVAQTIYDWITGALAFVLFSALIIRAMQMLQSELYRANEQTQQIMDALKYQQEILEQRVVDRTASLEQRSQELSVAGEIARDVAKFRDVDTLLSIATELIKERFNLYHVGIYLMDDRGEYALLRAASGAASQKIMESHPRIRTGSARILGFVAGSGQTYIIQDTELDPLHSANPLLPNTQAEIAIPLRSQNVAIGILNIHSESRNAFSDNIIRIFQLLADQLVANLENVQLAQQVQSTLDELRAAYQAQTQQVWQKATQSHGTMAFEYDGLQVRPIPRNISRENMKLLESGKAVKIHPSEHVEGVSRKNTLLVPLAVLNQVIGVIGIENDDPEYDWSDEEIAIAEAAANRAAIALENARLLEESQRRASKEQILAEATGRISSALQIENILYTTAEELERVLGGSEIVIQLQN